MIEPNDFLGGKTLNLHYPLSKRAILFISMKDWDGQALRLEVEFLKKLMENVFTIPPPPEQNKNKKFLKKLTELNNQLNKMTEFGTIFIFLEGRRGGNVYVGQASKLTRVNDWNFDEPGWNSFEEVFVFSIEGEQMSLNLRTAIEAKLLKFLMNSTEFTLLNDKAESEDKLRYAEFQLKEPEVVRFYDKIKTILHCLDISLLE